MQFHIDGRFQADIWCDNAAWTVQRTPKPDHGATREPLPASSLEDDDIGFYLDALFKESIDSDA
ncbi:MAG TPA: hypothetical protein VF663_09465 [Telluria sp.]|jgi:hypothetical protein